jgi:hypothetical protein
MRPTLDGGAARWADKDEDEDPQEKGESTASQARPMSQ